jgi:hypothetical protein
MSAANQWINLGTASRLLGLDIGLVCKRTADGHYGLSRKGSAPHEVLVTLRGIELAARRVWTASQVEAAKANRPLPPDPAYFNLDFPSHRNRRPRLSVDEIGARTVIERPME